MCWNQLVLPTCIPKIRSFKLKWILYKNHRLNWVIQTRRLSSNCFVLLLTLLGLICTSDLKQHNIRDSVTRWNNHWTPKQNNTSIDTQLENYHIHISYQVIQSALLSPYLEVTIHQVKGSLNQPKKDTRNYQVSYIFIVIVYLQNLKPWNGPIQKSLFFYRNLSSYCQALL